MYQLMRLFKKILLWYKYFPWCQSIMVYMQNRMHILNVLAGGGVLCPGSLLAIWKARMCNICYCVAE